jgi:hypothetical protein
LGNYDSPGSESGSVVGFVNTVMNLRIPLRWISVSWRIIIFSSHDFWYKIEIINTRNICHYTVRILVCCFVSWCAAPFTHGNTQVGRISKWNCKEEHSNLKETNEVWYGRNYKGHYRYLYFLRVLCLKGRTRYGTRREAWNLRRLLVRKSVWKTEVNDYIKVLWK